MGSNYRQHGEVVRLAMLPSDWQSVVSYLVHPTHVDADKIYPVHDDLRGLFCRD